MKCRKLTPQEKWRKRNPVANWAHSATRSAIRRGLLEKKPCERYGDSRAEAHHPDYQRPLLIEWLCRQCHKRAHSKKAVKS